MENIKKLPKNILEEGISLSLVNSINMKTSFSPVILQVGDKPVRLVPCSTGFWVMYESGQYLKDEKNKLIVFSQKDCRIGRIRYLLKYGKKEKAKKIADLLQGWKDQVAERIKEFKERVAELERFRDADENDTLVQIMRSINPEGLKSKQDESVRRLKKMQPMLAQLEKAWEENQIAELMAAFNIRSFPEFGKPMFTANFDSEHDMKTLINTFGGKALKKWDGDMLNRYATIEIEKEYPI